MGKIFFLLEFVFANKYLYKVNKFLYLLSLKGLGIDNQVSLTQRGEKKAITKLLKNTDSPVVLDVGANVGNYSMLVRNLKKDAIIFAFEPQPRTYEKLLSISSEFNLNPINKGCGDIDGKLLFYDYSNLESSEHASFLKEVFTELYHDKVKSYEVEVVKLDDFIAENEIAEIDLLKIDTEGYEYNVLKGCTKAISENKIKAIHFEFNSMNIISKVFMKDFIKMLPQYSFYRVLQNGLLKIEIENILLTEIFGFQNIVAINNKLK